MVRVDQPEGSAGSAVVGIDPSLPKYGADPTGAMDSTAAFQAAYADAVSAGHYTLTPSPGTYLVNGRIHTTGTTTNPVRIIALIPGSVVIQRSTAACIVEVVGSRTATVTAAADIAQGALSVSLSALPTGGLNAGDYLELSSNVPFATGVGASAATVAEIVRVQSITGTGPYTVNLYGPTEEAYTTANGAAAARVDYAGAGSVVSGVIFRQTAQNRDSADKPLIRFALCRDLRFAGVTCRDADVPGLELRGVLSSVIDDYRCENLTDNLGSNFIGYGISLAGNCRDIRVTRPWGRWVRHVFTTTFGTFTGSASAQDVGVPRHILVQGGQALETSSGPWNTHKEGKYITFDSCEAHKDKNGSYYIRSPHTTIVNPTSVECGTTLVPQITVAENEATDCTIIGGRIIGGTNTQNAIYSTCPRTRVIGTACQFNGNGNLIKFDTGATDWMVDNVYCQNPTGSGHIWASTGCTGVVRGGKYVSSGLKSITQAQTAGDVRFSGQATGTNIFGIDQNQRALTDQQFSVVSKSGNYTLTDQDGHVLFDATGAARTATLPAPTAAHVGRVHVITKKDASANTVTITAAGGSLFGTSSLTTQGQTVRAYSDGTNWFVS